MQELFRRDSTKQDFYVYGLGGCRDERRKWIHFFENMDTVIVVTPINSYSDYPGEDKEQVRAYCDLQTRSNAKLIVMSVLDESMPGIVRLNRQLTMVQGLQNSYSIYQTRPFTRPVEPRPNTRVVARLHW